MPYKAVLAAAFAGVALGAGSTYAILRKPTAAPTAQPPAAPSAQPSSPAAKPAPAPTVSYAKAMPLGPPVALTDEAREIIKYGLPGFENVIVREGYVLSYDRRTRNAHWTLEHLTADKLKGEGTRAESAFKEDPTQPPMFRAKLADYAGSGFDRGHLVPAGDNKTTQKAMDDTFWLTNMSPQVGAGFNRNYWSRFEQFVRNLTKEFQDVYVITGPLYLPKKEADGKYYVRYQMIGEPGNVAVPTHFYKVILAEKGGKRHVAAFVMDNKVIDDATPLEAFHVPLQQVESNAGLQFFNLLERAGVSPLCGAISCTLPSPDFFKNKGKKQ